MVGVLLPLAIGHGRHAGTGVLDLEGPRRLGQAIARYGVRYGERAHVRHRPRVQGHLQAPVTGDLPSWIGQHVDRTLGVVVGHRISHCGAVPILRPMLGRDVADKLPALAVQPAAAILIAWVLVKDQVEIVPKLQHQVLGAALPAQQPLDGLRWGSRLGKRLPAQLAVPTLQQVEATLRAVLAGLLPLEGSVQCVSPQRAPLGKLALLLVWQRGRGVGGEDQQCGHDHGEEARSHGALMASESRRSGQNQAETA
mmetsp:Transcript_111990/g.311823  ORF Transcript_111990/g.311823 Transcript_111990/m.311823 type:complete len:254 (-) Transcript_111990:8-769(-)